MESIISTNNISFLLVLIEGILSFFSPCVIPLIPVYMGYLAGNTDNVGKNGKIVYNRKKVFFNTIFFVLGISFSFFILGMSFTAIGKFFNSNKLLFTRISGILIIILGLFQIGIFDFNFLKKEKKFHINLTNRQANPLIAFIMGFTFSFAWTPCVGPALSSVLILASSAKSSIIGNALVLVYAIGFVVPFLLLGIFTTQVLNFLNSHKKLLKYTVKVGGIILILMGIMTFTGWMNGISSYLNSLDQSSVYQKEEDKDYLNNENDKDKNSNNNSSNTKTNNEDTSSEEQKIPAIDFTLIDQFGNEHTLSDYKGKVVFLNFWATWCPPCQKEMPDIEALYNEYNKNEGDVIFLGVANPRSENNMNTRELTKDEIISFLEEKEYTFPSVFDETGEVYLQYNISALPTTFLIDKDGNIKGYAPGMLTKEMMKNAIEQTLNSETD